MACRPAVAGAARQPSTMDRLPGGFWAAAPRSRRSSLLLNEAETAYNNDLAQWYYAAMASRAATRSPVSTLASNEPLDGDSGAPTIDDAHRAAAALRDMGAGQVLVFGSVATATAHPDSDIDLVAVFDDLGDYSTRPDLHQVAVRATSAAAGHPCEVLITDRPEWQARTRLLTSIESDICLRAVTLAASPASEKINWGKPIGKPASDAAEALADLADATQALTRADMSAVPTSREACAAVGGDLLRWDDERFRRMMFLCGHCHDAVRAALAAYSRGMERTRPARGVDGNRIAAVLEGLSAPAAKAFTDALAPLTAGDVAPWSDPGEFVRCPETLQRLTPQLASDIHTAARRCCRVTVDAVTARHGHTTWTRELLGMLDDDAPSQALRRQLHAPRYARKTYTRRCLTPPTGAPRLPNGPAADPPVGAGEQRDAKLAAV